MINSNFSPYPTPGDWPLDMSVTVSGNTAYNIFAMCNGDFNGSFTPNAAKDASANLRLTYGEPRQVGANTTFDLPIRTVNASNVGAVSLILNFPSDLVEVKDVTMNNEGGRLDWVVNGNELRIGWNSLSAFKLATEGTLITLNMKTTGNFTKGNTIRLTVAPDPLNELADNSYKVIPDAVLSTDLIEGLLTVPAPVAYDFTLENHPNPFGDYTIFEYTLPTDGDVTLEIHNMLGQPVKTLVNEPETIGKHSFKMDAGWMQQGIYTATLKLYNREGVLLKTIKIVLNK
jgi:hypothetical protein